MELNLKIYKIIPIFFCVICCGLPEIGYIGSPDNFSDSTILTTEQLAYKWNDKNISSNVIFQGFNIYYKFYSDVNDYLSDKDKLDDNTSLSYLLNTLNFKITSSLNKKNVPVSEVINHDNNDIYLLDFNQIVTESIDAQLILYKKYNLENQTIQNIFRDVISNENSEEYASFSDIAVSVYSDLNPFTALTSTDFLLISIAVSSVGISESDFSQLISEPVLLDEIYNIPVD